MENPMEPKAISPDIPVDKAWKTGRRIYVRTGYKTQLNDQIRELGGKWDAGEHALWVGSGKLEQVIPLVLAQAQRAAAVQAVKDAGRWVTIPFEADAIRAEAKRLGAKWDRDSKQWALPDDEAFAAVSALLASRAEAEQARAEAEKAERAAAQKAVQAEQARRDAEDASERVARIIAQSGRTATGQTGTVTTVSVQRMNKATAWAQAMAEGEIIKVRTGGGVKRGVITGRRVWFAGDEMASSVCWHSETHDQAHWDFRYDVAIVEPVAEEIAADGAAAAEKRDAEEIAAAIKDVQGSMAWTPEAEAGKADRDGVIAGRIRVSAGSTSYHDGTLTLTADGRVIWYHPGYYDDYRISEGITTDLDAVTRVRALIAAGSRVRYHDISKYTVTAEDDAQA